MKKRISYLNFVFFCLLSFGFCFSALAQPAYSEQGRDSIRRFKTAGALVGYGHAFSNNTLYNIYYFMGDFSWSFSKQPKNNDFVSLYFEPQFNLVHTLRPLDVEFGANLGIRNYIRVNPGLYFYQMLGSGPHFISAKLDRQATGFIFSDNLFLGALTRLKKDLFLNLQFGLRHISNANLALPNRGVNSINFRVGLSRRK
jgi:hypothetical protein